MVWNNITGKDECWHCGSEEHNTAGHMHGKTPSTPHPVAPAGEPPMQRRRTVQQASAEGTTVYAGRAPHTRYPYETLESARETYWADEAEKLRAENARLAGMLEHEGASHMAALDGWNKAEASLIAATAEVERLRGLLKRGVDMLASVDWGTHKHEREAQQLAAEVDIALAPPGSESQKKGDG